MRAAEVPSVVQRHDPVLTSPYDQRRQFDLVQLVVDALGDDRAVREQRVDRPAVALRQAEREPGAHRLVVAAARVEENRGKERLRAREREAGPAAHHALGEVPVPGGVDEHEPGGPRKREGWADSRLRGQRLDRVLGGYPSPERLAGEREVPRLLDPQEFAEEIDPGLDAVVDDGLVGGAKAELVRREDLGWCSGKPQRCRRPSRPRRSSRGRGGGPPPGPCRRRNTRSSARRWRRSGAGEGPPRGPAPTRAPQGAGRRPAGQSA